MEKHTSHVDVVAARSLVSEPVDQPGVGMKVENDGLVSCEKRHPIFIRQAMRVIGIVNKLEHIHDVDAADFQVGQVFQEKLNGS